MVSEGAVPDIMPRASVRQQAHAVKAIKEAITHHLTHPGNPQLPASDIQPAKPPRVCPHCYEPIPASRGPLAVYCSGRCGKAAQRARKGAQATRDPGVVQDAGGEPRARVTESPEVDRSCPQQR